MTHSVYLVRHAQSIGNREGSYAVENAGKLSDLGREQARNLRDALADVDVDVVASSPLERARRTIAPYLEARGETGEVWAELAEGCHQAFEDPDEADVGALRYGPELEPSGDAAEHFSLSPDAYPACRRPEGETFAEALARVRLARARIDDVLAGPDDSVLLVAHYHYLARLVELLLGIEPVPDKRFTFDNVAVAKLVRDGEEDSPFALRYVQNTHGGIR